MCMHVWLHAAAHAPLASPVATAASTSCGQVHALLNALETFDGGALALWTMDELALARGRSEHFKARLTLTLTLP